MKIAIIGRTEILFETAVRLRAAGHTIACVLTAKEAPEYTKTAADFERLAAAARVPFANTPRIESQEAMLCEARADVAVSINYTGVIPASLTGLFPLGILNAHSGDLPRYRGNACQAWAILNGESRVGLCIHRMIGGELDSGDIIEREFFPIDHTTKITAVYAWFGRVTPGMFVAALNKLAKNPGYILEAQSKNPAAALRCYPRRPEDGRIDWSKSNLEILRLINACNKPYAGAFCDFEGDKVIIWDAELVAGFENFCAVPGQVTLIRDGYVEVACGNGKLRILLAEYAGEVGCPDAWIRSIRKRLG